MKKRVLITGVSGMLGDDIRHELSLLESYAVFGIDKSMKKSQSDIPVMEGDLTDVGFVQRSLNEIKPNIIIHCAALVDVDFCESHQEAAFKLHVESTKCLARYNSEKTLFIYISTDSVFDGFRGNYTENDIAKPLNYYAHSKYEGEIAALSANTNSIIIRTNIYGVHNPIGKSLVEWALTELSRGNEIKGFVDTIFNPVFTTQLSRVLIHQLFQSKVRGVLNVVSDTIISKYHFLIELARLFSYPLSLIGEGYSKEINFKAPRPQNTSLDAGYFKKLFSFVPELKTGLVELKEKWNQISKN
jgi:dTDP-4-dehydrorhamnose reductase